MRLVLVLSAAFVLAPTLASAQSEEGCSQGCDVGHACEDGACVELCDPVCPQGWGCNAEGSCDPVIDLYDHDDDEPEYSGGYALGAGIMGVVTTLGTAITYIALGAGDFWTTDEMGIFYGVAATTALAAPIVAGGTLSANLRDNDAVLPFAVVGWISFTGFLVTALVSTGVAVEHGGDLPDDIRAAIGTFALVSHAAFTAGAFVTYAEFSSQSAPAPDAAAVAPFAAPRLGANGLGGAVLGATGRF